MIKSKAISGGTIRQGTLDDDRKNIQEDILCLMYLKGFKKGDESAESVIKGYGQSWEKMFLRFTFFNSVLKNFQIMFMDISNI